MGVLKDELPWITSGVLVVAEIIVTNLSIGSGGSGGMFGPSLYIGVLTGTVFGKGAHTLFSAIPRSHHTHYPVTRDHNGKTVVGIINYMDNWSVLETS